MRKDTKIYVAADYIHSALGSTSELNFAKAKDGISGITEIKDSQLLFEPFYGGRLSETFASRADFTRLENLFINSIESVLKSLSEEERKKTLLVLSTTKGNIDLLDSSSQSRLNLYPMAVAIQRYFDFVHEPIVVSNACISGLSALLVAKKMMKVLNCTHAVVAGGDLLSKFTLSGFNVLKALAPEPCRPYDANRQGINLGEACGAILLTTDIKLSESGIELLSGAQSNDANHISGPSRTGEGLVLAVEHALKRSDLKTENIDLINAHGTATSFNDEMEAIAFDRLGLGFTPLNSFKGYFGHTLGAAGIIESILTIHELKERTLLPSFGFSVSGVSKPLNVIEQNSALGAGRKIALKTASGFGGCNAAVIFSAP